MVQIIGTTKYEIFKNSSFWEERCAQLIEVYKTCVFCDSKNDLEIHCRDYARIRNADIYEDLTLLCNHCKHIYAKCALKENKLRRPKKKKVVERRKDKIRQVDELLWQESQNKFNEIKKNQGKKHLLVNKKNKFRFIL